MHTGERHNGGTNGCQRGGRVTKGEQEGEDPSVFKSRAKGTNLHELVSQMDTFEEDITKGYTMDPSFKTRNKIIYTKNRGGKDIVYIPSAMLAEMTLKTRILDQAHQVVGHYSPQRTSDYIR